MEPEQIREVGVARDGPDMSARAGLLHHTEHRWFLLRAYYAVLNGDQEFRIALGELRERLAPALTADDASVADDAVKNALDAFVEQWCLPRGRGAEDLWRSLRTKQRSGQPRLQPLSPWSFPFGAIGEPIVTEVIADDDEAHHLWEERVPLLLWPMPPEPIEYDPRDHTRPRVWLNEQIEQALKNMRDELYRQARKIEQQVAAHGWAHPPPQHSDPDGLQDLARRLYRRVVLRWTWARIAKADRQENARTVKSSVERWAAELGVPLDPDMSRPGRPRRRERREM